MKKCLVLFLILIFSKFLNGQQPAYFMLGEDQFRGIQIYDVIQDKELNYWFATNEGIYLFNYVNFEKIECEKAKSNSAFNFILDESGVIYCHNLNNQVFQIKNKECRVFYELKENEGGSDVSLAVGDNGNLLIASRQILEVNPSGKVMQRFKSEKRYIGPPLTLKNGAVQFHLGHSNEIILHSKGKFVRKKFNQLETPLPQIDVLKFFVVKDSYYAIDLMSKACYSYDNKTFTLSKSPAIPAFLLSESIRLYQSKNGYWVCGTLPGAVFSNDLSESQKKVFFEQFFISDIYEDAEGNILLSTFDKGILVIPDLKVPDVIHSFRDDPINSLFSDGKGSLLLGSSKGYILKYSNGELQTLSDTGKRPIEVLTGHPNGSWYIFDDGFIRAYNSETGRTVDLLLASLKDAEFISENEFFMGTNRGLVHVKHKGKDKFEVQHIPELQFRVHITGYDPEHKNLYVSTANGLFMRNESGKIVSIQYKGEDIFPNDIFYYKGQIYLSTKEKGVLILEQSKIVEQLIPKVNGKHMILKKIYLYQNTIIAKSADGLYQYDLKGKHLKSLHSIFGFSAQRVIDFTFHKGHLWVSHSGGVQEIDLNYKSPVKHTPFVRIDKIVVNEREMSNTKKATFTSDQRKIQFFFSSPTLRNRETILYQYRLLGNDEAWSSNNFTLNQVTYNALSPGTYTFQIRVGSNGNLSEIQSYTFTIALPLYLRWWFITILFLLFIGIVFLIYRWQLSVQRKKSERINELNASKLTAIQSQMNPHFIFNSLNSIQDLILKGDVEHSYSYISTFSNLVRRTLSYSEKDFIDFEQELKLLELYLSLEKLRFKKDFTYSITAEGVEDIMIPPLLVQPFIENALVHGLLHKDGEKKLTISFKLEDVLICTIEDNGIGRKAAKLIKQRQRSDHESFSGKAIHRRFEILSSVFNGEFGYSYVDLEENGIGVGTRVILKIPIAKKY